MSNKPRMKGLEHQNQKLQKDQGKSDDKENRLKNHKSDREPINTMSEFLFILHFIDHYIIYKYYKDIYNHQ